MNVEALIRIVREQDVSLKTQEFQIEHL